MSKKPQPTQRPCDCTVHCGDDRRDIEAGIAIPCEAYRRRQQEALIAEARAARLGDLITQNSHKADIDLLDALEELHTTKAQLTDCIAAKDGAYLERNQVVAALAKCFPSGTAQTPIEGWSPEWFGCVYIDLPTGQASWHFHTSQAYLFSGLPPYTREWDGHSTPVKYERLAQLGECSAAINNLIKANALIKAGVLSRAEIERLNREHTQQMSPLMPAPPLGKPPSPGAGVVQEGKTTRDPSAAASQCQRPAAEGSIEAASAAIIAKQQRITDLQAQTGQSRGASQ